MSDADIRRILEFWFSGAELASPNIDARMDRWFGNDPDFDRQIKSQFGDLVERALAGQLDDWQQSPQGRLALILLLDQFPRNIFRGRAEAFSGDRQALRICVEGIVQNDYRSLSSIEQLFFFMPLQHAESLKVQQKSVSIYQALAKRVSETQRETFLTAAHFAELHRDIIEEFGRFPHRNAVLGRKNTPAEEQYLSDEEPAFGQ